MNQTAITINNLTHIYKLYNKPIDMLKESIHPFRKKYHRDFYAIKNINFEIRKGEIIGIIGKNGAGKSTLLKLITGIFPPTRGTISVNGRLSSILELGTGFNPELSGLDNIYFVSSILDIPPAEIKMKLNTIIEFADIGDFIYQPVKVYSSGMFVRLAFAIAINIDPDILLIDEALAVGDVRFKKKCFRRLNELKEHGCTIAIVTHDTHSVINFCERAVWLKDGELFQMGKPSDVVKDYISFMTYGTTGFNQNQGKGMEKVAKPVDNQTHRISWIPVNKFESFGSGGAEITGVALYHQASFEKVKYIQGGEDLILYIRIAGHEVLNRPGIGIIIIDNKGNHITGMNNYVYEHIIEPLTPGKVLIGRFSFKFPHLKTGDYTISLAVSDGSQKDHIQHHWVHDSFIVQVRNTDLKYNMGSYLILDDVSIDHEII